MVASFFLTKRVKVLNGKEKNNALLFLHHLDGESLAEGKGGHINREMSKRGLPHSL